MDIYELAFTDTVTGLHNRNYFEHALRRQYCLAQDLGVLLVAPDFFAQYAELFGRQQGDAALSALGRGLVKLHQERVCRYDSATFLAFVENCDGQLRDWAEDTRAAIAAVKIPVSSFARVPGHELYCLIDHVTASVGGAKRKPHEPLDNMLCRADTQLYHAKKRRDCVMIE